MRALSGAGRWGRMLAVVGAVAVVAGVPVYLALASNMGFKLKHDLGTQKAINRLLLGSGVSLDVEPGGKPDPADTYLVLEVGPSTKDSNMGFRITTHLDPPKEEAALTLWGDPVVGNGVLEGACPETKLEWSVQVHELPKEGMVIHFGGKKYTLSDDKHSEFPMLLLIPN